MSMLPLDPAIARLRVRSPRRDGAGLRLDVTRELCADALRPRHLAPSSILLVRRVELVTTDSLSQSNELARARRQRAIQSRMQEIRDRAVRPLRGVIDPGSEALLFADEAELVACIVRQFALGSDTRPWWCHAVRRYFSSSSLLAVLAARIELLPGVFTLLNDWRVAAFVALKLTVAECVELREALVRQRELRHLDGAIRLALGGSKLPSIDASMAETVQWGSGLDRERAEPESPDTTALAGDSVSLSSSNSPFDLWLDAPGRALDSQRALLLGTALGAAKDTRTLASLGFARSVTRWLADAATRQSSPLDLSNETAGQMMPLMPSSVVASGELCDELAGEKPAIPDSRATSSVAPGADATDARSLGAETAAQHTDAEIRALEGEETELGGVFMLINVMEHLGLPECFEESCGLVSGVGTIGTLEALARVLAGTRGEELAHDPIWSMLADLDRREPHSPPRAEGLRNPDAKLPDAWLAQLGDEALALREPDRVAIQALRRAGWPPALLAWLTLVIPFIGWRIAQACALDSVDEAVRLLIDMPARIYVTASHIDVVTSIENIRVPLRLAGLDRSPGWVRSMQRVVLFHFE